MNTQHQLLRRHFDSGLSLTRIDAHLELGIANVTARISELRNSGYQIATTMKKVKNRAGKTVKIAVWSKL